MNTDRIMLNKLILPCSYKTLIRQYAKYMCLFNIHAFIINKISLNI